MARHAKGRLRSGFSALFAPLLVAVGLVTVPVAAPPAMASNCPAGISITPVHSSTLFWDKKGNDNITGAHLGYRVSNSSGATLTSVSVGVNLAATGSADIKLGGGQPASESIGSLPNGQTAMAYFLVDVKQGAGTQSVTATLSYNSTSCTVTQNPISTPSRRALAANANKIFSAKVVAAVGGTTGTAPSSIAYGSFATVVVTGNTGTIGAGPAPDFRQINLTPVVYPSDFAADAWKLVDVTFRSSNANCGTSGVISNQLHISSLTSPSSASCGGLYSAAFTFQSRNSDENAASEVQAFSYISSGNLIKHTSPFGGTIGLPTVSSSGTATTAATVDLAQELSAAIASGAVGFTAEELSMIVYQGQTQTAPEPSFVSGTAPVSNICLVNPADANVCSDGPFTVKNLKEDETQGTTDAGTFRIVQVDGRDRVQFTASASYYIGGANATDQPARIVMRLSDSKTPTPATSDSFANAAVVQGSPPTTTGDTSSGNLNTAQTLTVASTGSSLTKCVFSSLPMPEPCSSTSTSADGSWVLDGANNTVTYTPTNGFVGTATIYFGVTDGQGAMSFAELSATVIGAPTATTQAASSVATTSATLNGSITTGGLSTDVKFCWGTSSLLTSCTEVVPGSSPLSHSATAQSVSANLTGLSAATLYYFRVSAQNTQNSPSWADGSILSFTTTSTAPTVTTTGASNVAATSATLGGSVTAGSFDATPSFILSTSNSVNGSGALTQNAGTGAGAGSAVTAGATEAISEAWSGLTSGTTYYFQAVATPTTGSAVYGAVQSFTAGATASAPTATTSAASNVDNTTATLNGSVNPNNGSTSIHFCWGTASNLASCTKTSASPSSGSGSSSVSASLALTGLTADTPYYFQIIANNGVGGDVFGTIETFTTTSPPLAITNTPTSVSGEGATLRGRVNPKGNSTSGEFCLRKAASAGENPNASTFCASGTTSVPLASSVSGAEQDVTIAVNDLEPNTEYVYQLKTSNNKGNAVGAIERFTTSQVPPIPVTQAASNVTGTSATIAGTVNPRNKQASIKFCWGTDSNLAGCTKVNGGTSNGNGNSPVSSTVALSSLTPGTTYYYRIIGNNGVGGVQSLSSFVSGPVFSFYPTFLMVSAFTNPVSYGYLAAELNDVNGGILNFTTQSALAATTTSATSVTDTTATINGTVNPGNESTNVTFCFGTDSSLNTCTSNPVPSNSPLSGTSTAAVSVPMTGLLPSTTYYFRVSATNSGQGTVTGSILSFTTSATVVSPPPASPVIEESDPCVPEVALSSTEGYVELGLAGLVIDLFSLTGELTHSAAMSTYHSAMESDLVVALALNQAAQLNPQLNSSTYQRALAKAAEVTLFAKSNPKTLTQADQLSPSEVVVAPGSEPNSVSLTTSTGEPLELLSVQSIDLNLYAAFTGAELNNPAVWQGIGYGMQCWKLEPFVDTWFYLPVSAQPPGAAPGNWVFSNVIVKAGSITADPTTFQANTLFPSPKGGEMVWADVNGNGVYDPGGKGGDKAISHIVLCANLISSATPIPSPTPTVTPSPSPSPTQAVTPSPSPTQTATPTPTPTSSPAPEQTASPTPTPTPTASPTPTPTVTPVPSPEPTRAACSTPKVAPPSPAPTPTILIRNLGTPTPSPTPTTSPSPSPTASPTPTVSPSPTPTASPTPTTSPSPTPTASPTPTVSPSPSPTASPTPTVSPSPSETPSAAPTPAPGPTARPEGPVPIAVFDVSPPTNCEPSATFGVAMKLTNGLSTTCFRMTTSSFVSIAAFGGFSSLPVAESAKDPEELADTGADVSYWLLVAMLLMALGSSMLVYARKRA